MARSMTGFGHSETSVPDYKMTVEIKSVNHRYCDLNIKLPKRFNAFENQIRKIVKEYAFRGKIDVYVNYEDFAKKRSIVRYHQNIARGYMEAARCAADEFQIETAVSAAALMRYPEVVTLEEEETDDTLLYPALETTLRRAMEQFQEERSGEGERLQADLLAKLDLISEYVAFVEERSPKILQEYRRKIQDKVEELLGSKQIDDSILATEITVFADKVCVDEETVRLQSHIQNMKDTLQMEGAIGRKLDFIAQEMNREANTILSKANDVELSNTAIDLKTEIEKIREQIQNIE